jgi:RND family efflux transporter MFP subunit
MNTQTIDHRHSLLDQLRIDRGDDAGPGGRFWPWVLGVTVLVAGITAAAWFLLTIPATVLVDVATAELVSADVPTGRGSMLDASGYVVARRQATVSSKITGKVVEVSIEEGQRVEANEVIARLDDANALAQVAQATAQREQAVASLIAAQVAFDNAVPTFARNQEQLARSIISAQAFDTAKAAYDTTRTTLDVAARAVEVADANLSLAQRNLDDTVVRAPFGGVITVKAAQEGEMVSPVSAGGGFTRTGIGTIVDMDSLEVEVDVSENFINRVRAGQDMSVRLNAYPEWAIPARVIAIIPTADRAKATVRVRVALDERDARILPEMGVRVSFLDDDTQPGGALAAQRAVVVPPSAVQGTGDTGIVYVIDDDTVERRAVRLGTRSVDGQIVLSGLESGARLAVTDFSQLSDGARVRVSNQ